MHKSATKCNETLSKWCKNKHGTSKIMDTLETYQRVSILSDEDSIQVSNMSDALRVVAGAVNNTCHAETHPDLCKTIMDLPNFELDQKLAVLDYLTEHKGKGLNFVKMEDDARKAAFKRIIAKNPDLV
jgi:hypothetical protein